MGLNPKIWLPRYHFIMQTIAISYPMNPNDVSKKNIMILFKISQYFFLINHWVKILLNY